MNETPVIQTRGLTRYYGARAVVQDLNLEVQRGSVFAFLGRNGSGKTTTIRMLLGLVAPTRGGGSVGSDEAEDPLLNTIGELWNALGGRVAPLLQIAHGPLDLPATLAQFALDADASFTNLTLDPVAGGHAAALEPAQLRLGLGGGPVA